MCVFVCVGVAATKYVPLFEPTDRISAAGTINTKNFLIIETLEDVKSRLHFWKFEGKYSYSLEHERIPKNTYI